MAIRAECGPQCSIKSAPIVQDLRGLYIEADSHDAGVRDQFEVMWSPIDAQDELRTEPWDPLGSASNETLTQALDAFAEWVIDMLAADPAPQHG